MTKFHFKITIIISFLFLNNFIFAQKTGEVWNCYTTAQNTKELINTRFNTNPKFIKIFVHIIRRSNGTGSLTNVQINNSILNLSSDYQDLNIFFIETGRDFINNTSFYDGISSEAEYNALINTNRHTNAIDIYFLSPTESYSRASGIPGDALAFGGSYAETSVLSHEIGHCLGLFHTHSGSGCGDNANCEENIDGSNCSTCGDLVCDTPADPCLSGNVDSNCNYTGGGGYSPDVDNIMSYAPPTCLDDLTNGQMRRLHNFITNSSILQELSYSPEVHGTNIVCTSPETFTLLEKPRYSSVTWTHSSNLTKVSQPPHHEDPNKYIVKANSNYASEYGWVKAKITLGIWPIPFPMPAPLPIRNKQSYYFMKYFWIGIPPDFTINGTNELEPDEYGVALIQHDENWDYLVNNVDWSYTGATLTYLNGNTERADFRAGSAPGVGYIYASAENQCGQKENRMFYEIIDNWHKVYPNPVNDILTIEIERDKMPEDLKTETIELRLYDKMMNLKKIKIFTEASTTINIKDLNPDVYILQIIVGNKIIEEKIIVTE